MECILLPRHIDIEIIHLTQQNVYPSKKDFKGETRLAVTAHAKGEIGVCFEDHMVPEVRVDIARNMTQTIDFDIDMGADTVDYNATSLSTGCLNCDLGLYPPERPPFRMCILCLQGNTPEFPSWPVPL